MNRYRSPLALWTRRIMPQALLAMLLAAAAQLAGFRLILGKLSAEGLEIFTASWNLETALSQAGTVWIFRIGFVLVGLAAALPGWERGDSRWRYTTRRLGLSPGAVTVCHALTAAACFMIYWGVELAAVLGIIQMASAASDPSHVSGQTAFLAFYQTPLFHSLLPLENWTGYARNVLEFLALGLLAAWSGERKSWRVFYLGLMMAAGVWFPQDLDRTAHDIVCIVLALLLIGCVTYALAQSWKEAEDA